MSYLEQVARLNEIGIDHGSAEVFRFDEIV
jgi:hypothetical protein